MKRQCIGTGLSVKETRLKKLGAVGGVRHFVRIQYANRCTARLSMAELPIQVRVLPTPVHTINGHRSRACLAAKYDNCSFVMHKWIVHEATGRNLDFWWETRRRWKVLK